MRRTAQRLDAPPSRRNPNITGRAAVKDDIIVHPRVQFIMEPDGAAIIAKALRRT
jgi:hypothetical protein